MNAEERVALAFYDVGRLYDTIPSSFYNDKAYTPNDSNHWDSERYNTKIQNISAAIDSMQMPVVALYGVENEEVVRDIVRCSNQDYSYTHRNLDYYDGLDFALLYYGDKLLIKRVLSTYHTMIIEADWGETTLALHLTRVGSKLRTTTPPTMESSQNPDVTIAWGQLTRKDLKRLMMNDLTLELEKGGEGDSKDKIGWKFKNRIGIQHSEDQSIDHGVYITKWLLNRRQNAPLATFTDGNYLGGYSNSLPLYLYINSSNTQ